MSGGYFCEALKNAVVEEDVWEKKHEGHEVVDFKEDDGAVYFAGRHCRDCGCRHIHHGGPSRKNR